MNPMIWRNVCPLATLNELGSRRSAGRLLTPPVLTLMWAVGIGLLVLMVPARRFLFNANGVAMTVTVSAVAVLAVATGLVVSRRAGFCKFAVSGVAGGEALWPGAAARRGERPVRGLQSLRVAGLS